MFGEEATKQDCPMHFVQKKWYIDFASQMIRCKNYELMDVLRAP
ncbi:hypothetical protein BIW11_03746 [Tropilaelaps mercedesae]|uniref:Uncharacterized protein n=1 Tax=Tropilaelaps mercedesae TaxID=418985 RepID=A0A1V9XGC0_9ACAR|nr:hypothetical protein BIW11_03746 [Tropilaelaps mercedesae]